MRKLVEQANLEKAAAVRDEPKVEIDPDLLAALKEKYPEMFAGTPEWNLRVRVAAAQRMYEESGLVIME